MPVDPRKNNVLTILERYLPIDRKVPSVNPALPNYMFKLVRSDEDFDSFKSNPTASLERNGIDPTHLDVKMFSELAEQLRRRANGQASLVDRYADEIMKSETDHSENVHWDQSGPQAERTKGSQAGATKNFEGLPTASRLDDMLRHELNLLFFPSQPLVTPSLIAEIRQALEKEGLGE
jgi:hypothetical protein